MRDIRILIGAGMLLLAPQFMSADTLHGFCVSPTPACSDNGTITPTNTNPPAFGFNSSGTATGNFELLLLVPNNEDKNPSSLSLTLGGTNVTNSSATSSLFNTSAFTTGKLEDYLSLSYTPSNPINALLPSTQTVDAGATGYYVYTFNFGAETGNPKNTDSAPAFSITNGPLAQGSVFLGLELNDQGGVFGATQSTGAIFEAGAPPPSCAPEPANCALLGIGILALGLLRKRTRGARLQHVRVGN